MRAKEWAQRIAGPQPVLRLIALLLAVIAYLLFALLEQAETIEQAIPYIEVCGGDYNPCHTIIDRG